MSTRVVLLGNLEFLDRGEAKRVSIPAVKHSVARQEVGGLATLAASQQLASV